MTHGKQTAVKLEAPLWDELDRLAGMQVAALHYGDGSAEHRRDGVRLSVGRMIGYIVDNMEEEVRAGQKATDSTTTTTAGRVAASSRPPVRLYSAHDTTLLPLLLAVGAFDDRWPPFAASLAFELHRLNNNDAASGTGGGQFDVTVRYNHEPVPIKGCSDPNACPWPEFAALMRGRYVPKSWVEECKPMKGVAGGDDGGTGAHW